MYFCMKYGLTLFSYYKRVYSLFDRTNIATPYKNFLLHFVLKIKVQFLPILVLKCRVVIPMYIKFASRKHIDL